MKKIVLKGILGMFLVLILAALPALAQGRRPAGPPNPLVRLERALQAANAPALTPDEQSRITSLISSTTLSQPPSNAVQALEASILAGNTDQIAAKAITDNTAANFLVRANFASSVAQILTGGGQLTPLVTKFGSTRVVQLLHSLVGGGFQGRRGLGMVGPEAQ
jgi:hypothetical protein